MKYWVDENGVTHEEDRDEHARRLFAANHEIWKLGYVSWKNGMPLSDADDAEELLRQLRKG